MLIAILLPFLGALVAITHPLVLGPSGTMIFMVANMMSCCLSSYYLLFLGAVEGYVFSYSIAPWVDFMWGSAEWGFWFDPISSLMCATVATVSVLVHLYSCYYMETDPYIIRFLTYLTLFTFFMLFLVSADNLVMLFFGWEGVGLCSYLLINFWYTRPQANKASLKAVIVNRIGDCGLLFAIIFIIIQFGCVDFQTLFAQLVFNVSSDPVCPKGNGLFLMEIVCICLFIGVMAKSAQVGLHTWLPDAMEGPTPVSALIHAATMVTAGIYLLIRTIPLFECAPRVLVWVALVGGITAVFAATVALAQHDVKKIIAYSTCSQLGYMVMACGVSHSSLALFHLINHAFFKALFFLGAGVVIHCLGGEQDIRRMGALSKFFPTGFATMFIASLALAGFPFFSGFYSKDGILGLLIAQSTVVGNVLWGFGVFAAVCTSVYSAGLVYFMFLGTPRGVAGQYKRLHDVPELASAPMEILALFSVTSGLFLKDYLIGQGVGIYGFGLQNFTQTKFLLNFVEWIPPYLKLLTLFAALSGFLLYGLAEMRGISPLFGIYPRGWYSIYRFLYFRWYWDVVYNRYVAWPVWRHSYLFFYRYVEKGVIEGFSINLSVWAGLGLSGVISSSKPVNLSRYIFWVVLSFLLSWEWVVVYQYVSSI